MTDANEFQLVLTAVENRIGMLNVVVVEKVFEI
jgi:hypothetical protein